jgi:hypothetical protein
VSARRQWPRLDATKQGCRHAVTAAGERIELPVNGGMRSPAGVFAGAADRVLPGTWHV